jgi:hypothetical protein
MLKLTIVILTYISNFIGWKEHYTILSLVCSSYNKFVKFNTVKINRINIKINNSYYAINSIINNKIREIHFEKILMSSHRIKHISNLVVYSLIFDKCNFGDEILLLPKKCFVLSILLPGNINLDNIFLGIQKTKIKCLKLHLRKKQQLTVGHFNIIVGLPLTYLYMLTRNNIDIFPLKSLKNLVSLNLMVSNLTNNNNIILNLPKLKYIYLCSTSPSVLLKSIKNCDLEKLLINDCYNIFDEDIEHIVQKFKNIKKLSLLACDFLTEKSIKLLNTTRLKTLRILFFKNSIKDLNITSLENLCISSSEINDLDIKYISSMPIKKLRIFDCKQITYKCLNYIKDLKLDSLNIDVTNDDFLNEIINILDIQPIKNVILYSSTNINFKNIQNRFPLINFEILNLYSDFFKKW